MNSLERYNAMLNNEAVDFIPRLPILMQYAAEYIGSNYGEYAEDFNVLTESHLQCAKVFGMDQLSVISDPYRESSGFGGEVYYEESGPKCNHGPLEFDKDLSLLTEPDPLRSPRMLDRVNAVKRYKEKAYGEYSIMGWVEGPGAEAADIRGVTNFFMDLLDDPSYIGELMDRCVEVGIEFAKVQIEAGADTIGVGDAICSQVSPDLYEQLILPRQIKLLNAIKQAGARIRLHICGNITHLFNGLSQLPIDIIDVDHLVDMLSVRKTLGESVALSGNIDPVAGVLRGTPRSIVAYVQETYQQVGNPFFVNAGCEIPSGTPIENIKALCEPLDWRA